jgi:hypothetical protein
MEENRMMRNFMTGDLLIYDLWIYDLDFPNISFSCQRAGIEILHISKKAAVKKNIAL